MTTAETILEAWENSPGEQPVTGLDRTELANSLRYYLKHGRFADENMRGEYDRYAAVKRHACILHDQGEDAAVIARKLNVSLASVRRWAIYERTS